MEIATGSAFMQGRQICPIGDFFLVPNRQNVYEVIRVIDGQPLFLEDHLDRLDESLTLEQLPRQAPREELRNRIMLLSKHCTVSEGNIKLLVNGAHPGDLYLYFIPHRYPEDRLYQVGVDTRTLFLERENPNAKVLRSSFRNTVRNFLKNQEIYEALLVNREGFITEGSRSNVFFFVDGALVTPPLKDVLGGVTRKHVLELARAMEIPLWQEPLHMKRLSAVEGAFLTGTSPKVLPIRSINGILLPSATHPHIQSLLMAYDDLVERYLSQHHLT